MAVNGEKKIMEQMDYEVRASDLARQAIDTWVSFVKYRSEDSGYEHNSEDYRSLLTKAFTEEGNYIFQEALISEFFSSIMYYPTDEKNAFVGKNIPSPKGRTRTFEERAEIVEKFLNESFALNFEEHLKACPA